MRALLGAGLVGLLCSGCVQIPSTPPLPEYEPDIWWWQRGEICTLTEWQAWAERNRIHLGPEEAVGAYAIAPRATRLIRQHAASQDVAVIDAIAYSADHGAHATCGQPSYWYYWIRTPQSETTPGPNWTRAMQPLAWIHYSDDCRPAAWDSWARAERRGTTWSEKSPDVGRADLIQDYFAHRGHALHWTTSHSYDAGEFGCKEIVVPKEPLNLRQLDMVPLPMTLERLDQ